MNVEEINGLFEREFGPIKEKFHVLDPLSVEEARNSSADFVWHPGVYVWIHPEKGVIRVGRHLTNSRKRALEHIGANTGGIMAEIAQDPQTRIMLFNVIDPKQVHWVAALEIYFESQLNPLVKAGRHG